MSLITIRFKDKDTLLCNSLDSFTFKLNEEKQELEIYKDGKFQGYGHSICGIAEDEFVKGVCPTGWHLPKDADVKQLIVDADGSITAYDDLNVAGLKLRAESWEGGSDDYGFSVIGGGYASLSSDGKMSYDDLTSAFYMWTDTQRTKDNAYTLYLYYDEDEASIYNDRKYYLEAVRCIKD